MSEDHIAITNLIYTYNDLIDKGDLKGATNLFQHAKLRIPTSDRWQDHKALLAMLERVIIIYDDGTPKTRHLVSNPIIEINSSEGKAKCRSTFTVLQQTEKVPLQVIATGYYNDGFELIDNKWNFSFRDFTDSHLYGDISGHLRFNAL